MQVYTNVCAHSSLSFDSGGMGSFPDLILILVSLTYKHRRALLALGIGVLVVGPVPPKITMTGQSSRGSMVARCVCGVDDRSRCSVVIWSIVVVLREYWADCHFAVIPHKRVKISACQSNGL